MKYEVQLVDDDAMPDGRDLVIVERGPTEPAVMLLAGRPAEVWRAMCEWEAAHDIPAAPTLLYAMA